MGIFLTILAALLIGVGLFGIIKGKWVTSEYSPYERKRIETEHSIRWIGWSVLAIGALVLFLSSFSIVGAKNVAVEHSFGQPRATLTNGWNWTAPWSSTEHFDASIQPLKLSEAEGDNGAPLTVQMAKRTITAQVEVMLEWQLDDTKDITPLWKEYRSFDRISKDVINRRLSSALNSLFDTYDPLASLKGTGTTVSLTDLESDAKAKLQAILPEGIQVVNLYLPKFIYPASVQAQLDQYIAAVNDTKIAEQQKLTAEARKRANEALAAGDTLSPGVLYQNCLDLVERLAKDGKALPPAFTCSAPPVTVVPVK